MRALSESLHSFTLAGLLLLLGVGGSAGCEEDSEPSPAPPPPEGCSADTDCEEAYFCYRTDPVKDGICSQGCRTDPDNCGEDRVCSSEHFCKEIERPCTGDVTCPDRTTYCELETGKCVPGCRSNSDCPELQECKEHECVPLPDVCRENRDCPEGHWCDKEVPRGRCTPGCGSNEDCTGEDESCIDHRCTDCPRCPYPCDDDSPDPDLHCVTGFYCGEFDQTCHRECRDDSSCTGGLVCCAEEICKDRECVQPCQTEGPYACPEGWICDVPTGHCFQKPQCENDSQCQRREICEGNNCRTGCRRDEACHPNEYCEPLTLLCQPAECRTDEQCGENRVCVDHTCLTRPCVTPDDCPGGYYCDLARNLCHPGCGRDADCAGGEQLRICGVDHQCVDGCTRDEVCDPGRVCERASGHCIPGCRDDEESPDDSREQARVLELENGTYQSPEHVLCTGNEDWYAVQVQQGDTLQASISYAALEGDLQLQLLDIQGEVLARSENLHTTRQWVNSAEQAEASVLYLRIAGSGLPEAGGRNYQLFVQVTSPEVCAGDAGEPNERYTESSLLGEGQQDGLMLCPEDEDWYRFEMQAGDGISLQLHWNAGRLPPSLELHHLLPGQGLQRLAVGLPPAGEQGLLEIELDAALSSSTHYVRVSADDLDQGLPYSLELAVEHRHPPCADDELEQNDTQMMSRPLDGDLYDATWAGLQLCSGNEDWYSLELQPGESLRLELLHRAADGNLDMELYQGINRVAAASSSQDNEIILMRELEPTPYQVRIFGRAHAQNSYTLHVEQRLTRCVPDSFEENDGLDQARRMSCGSALEAISCFGDEDYYRFQLQELSNVELNLAFRPEAGLLDLELLDSSGQVVEEHTEETEDGLVLTRRNLGAAPYYVNVYALEDLPSYYQLSLECTPGVVACAPDDLEPNNELFTAFPLVVERQPQPVGDLRICPGEEDWFLFEVSAGDDLRLLASFFHFAGDLRLNLYCYGDQAELVAESDSSNDDEEIFYSVLQDGICFLQVAGTPQQESGTSYTLTLTRD